MKKKRKCEVGFPVDWENGCCCLCKFSLIINATKFDVSLENMILKEHKFLRKKKIFFKKIC